MATVRASLDLKPNKRIISNINNNNICGFFVKLFISFDGIDVDLFFKKCRTQTYNLIEENNVLYYSVEFVFTLDKLQHTCKAVVGYHKMNGDSVYNIILKEIN